MIIALLLFIAARSSDLVADLRFMSPAHENVAANWEYHWWQGLNAWLMNFMGGYLIGRAAVIALEKWRGKRNEYE